MVSGSSMSGSVHSGSERLEFEPKFCSVKGCHRLAAYYCRGCRRYFCEVHASHE